MAQLERHGLLLATVELESPQFAAALFKFVESHLRHRNMLMKSKQFISIRIAIVGSIVLFGCASVPKSGSRANPEGLQQATPKPSVAVTAPQGVTTVTTLFRKVAIDFDSYVQQDVVPRGQSVTSEQKLLADTGVTVPIPVGFSPATTMVATQGPGAGAIAVFQNVAGFGTVAITIGSSKIDVTETQFRANNEKFVTDFGADMRARGGLMEVHTVAKNGQAVFLAHEPLERKWTTTFISTSHRLVSVEMPETVTYDTLVGFIDSYVLQASNS